MEDKWETIKQKKIERLEKELNFFVDKLDRIRSNQISLKTIQETIVDYKNEKKTLKRLADSWISSNYELVIKAFEPKTIPLITRAILNNQLGYKIENKKAEGGEIWFTLAPINKEKKVELIKKVKLTTEESKKSLHFIRQELKKWLKSALGLSQDQKKTYEKQIDELGKKYQNKLLEIEKKKVDQLRE